jgi:hypothetical protein
LIVWCAIALTATPASVLRADIIMIDPLRGTATDANMTGAFPLPVPDGATSTAGGQFMHDAMTMADAAPEFVTTNAHHDSTIPIVMGPSMFGSGAIDFDVMRTMSAGSGFAQSFFDVFFEVSLSGDYALTGDLERHSNAVFAPSATVLFEEDMGFKFLNQSVMSFMTEPFDVTVPLVPLTTYHLKLVADVNFDFDAFAMFTDANGGSSWNFSLAPTAVPEPSSLALLAIGTMGLIGRRLRIARGYTRHIRLDRPQYGQPAKN